MERRCTANENSRGTNRSLRIREWHNFSIAILFFRAYFLRRCRARIYTLYTRRSDGDARDYEENARITSTWKCVVDEGMRDGGRGGWLYPRASRPGISYELYAF